MKTMKTMLAFAAGALVLSACSNGDILNGNENNGGARPVTLTAYQEGGTRAAIGGTENTRIDWSENDSINYFGGGTGEYMTLSSGAGTATGSFSGTVTAGTDDYALYPYDAEAACSEGTITTTIPSAQSVPAGTFDPKAGLMAGKVSGTSVQFYNAAGYIAVTIPSGSGNITKMVITGNNNERLSGKVTISNITTDAAPAIAGTQRTWASDGSNVESDGVKYVEVTPNGTATFTAGSTYYVAVAPDATLSKGIYVLLYEGSKSAPNTLRLAVRKSTNSLAMARARVVEVTLPAIADGDWKAMIALNDANNVANGLYMAPFNLGATASTGNTTSAYGNYYSFGEVDTKSKYSESAYTGAAALTGLTDAATSNWGPDWRMPTKGEWDNNKSDTSVKGLPLPGVYFGTGLSDAGFRGIYWSSTPNGSDRAYCLFTGNFDALVSNSYRYYGYSVRPVLAQ